MLMATLTEPSLYLDHQPQNRPSHETGDWGLLLIPVLVCISMLIFALAA